MEPGECGTDQRLIGSIIEFDWPCEKRTAHGPHVQERVLGGPYPEEAYYCPGVAAHPAVMIGRASPRGWVEPISPPDHPAG